MDAVTPAWWRLARARLVAESTERRLLRDHPRLAVEREPRDDPSDWVEMTPERRARARQLRAEGLEYDVIAERLGCHPAAARRAVQRYGHEREGRT